MLAEVLFLAVVIVAGWVAIWWIQNLRVQWIISVVALVAGAVTAASAAMDWLWFMLACVIVCSVVGIYMRLDVARLIAEPGAIDDKTANRYDTISTIFIVVGFFVACGTLFLMETGTKAQFMDDWATYGVKLLVAPLAALTGLLFNPATLLAVREEQNWTNRDRMSLGFFAFVTGFVLFFITTFAFFIPYTFRVVG